VGERGSVDAVAGSLASDLRLTPASLLAYGVVGLFGMGMAISFGKHQPALALGMMIHGVAVAYAVHFFRKARRQRTPVAFSPRERMLVGASLVVVLAVTAVNVVAIMVFIRPGMVGAYAGVSAFTILMLVLCWRVWFRPSRRRAAVFSLLALLFAVPGLITSASSLFVPRMNGAPVMLVDDDQVARLTAAQLAMIAVVIGAMIVLDRVFVSIGTRADAALPEAVVHD
jgi:hypothetical protein